MHPWIPRKAGWGMAGAARVQIGGHNVFRKSTVTYVLGELELPGIAQLVPTLPLLLKFKHQIVFV